MYRKLIVSMCSDNIETGIQTLRQDFIEYILLVLVTLNNREKERGRVSQREKDKAENKDRKERGGKGKLE